MTAGERIDIRPRRPDAPTREGRVPSRDLRLADLARAEGRAAARLRLALAAERLVDGARRDLDDGLALPALVVVFACGIVLYFLLPREPSLAAVTAVAAAAIAVTAVRRRRGHAARLAATIATLLLGIAAATFETVRVAAPRLDHERTVTVEGRVAEVDATARGGLRMTVEVWRMEARGLRAETTPTRITATLTVRGPRPDVGDGVRFKARLKPPEGPVMPGGYDFARRAWFEGRGAGGYVLGRVERIAAGDPGWTGRFLVAVGSLRHAIAERVRASLPGATGAIAAALMVGEQRAIPDEAAEPLRASGLTHIVSISGLHMSLVAGGVIVAVRGLLALVPGLALAFPIRKWAAFAAFLVATVYLLLSGNQVAALRSHLMLSVALLAVLVDRPAITMHTVAVSAAVILAVDPSSVMEPSFLMSYLAVIALVASWDLYRSWVSRRPPPRRETALPVQLLGAGLRQIEGFAVSSLVAGLATAPVIAGVFFRGAPYSILANMAVLPVTGLVTMPAAVVAALAMPFGLDHWPLQVMGLGVDWMVTVGRWAAALPGGAGVLGAPHPAMMPLGIAAVLWVSVWKSRIRLLGVAPALLAFGLAFVGPRPDMMIGRHGTPIAVRGDDGRLRILGARDDRFAAGIWLAADADTRPATDPTLAETWRCDTGGCVFTRRAAEAPTDDTRTVWSGDTTGDPGGATPPRAPRDPPRYEIAVVRRAEAFEEDCRRAALIVTTLVAPPGCRDLTQVVDRIDLDRGGATAIDFVGLVRPVDHGPPRLRAATPDDRRASARVTDPTTDPNETPPEGPTIGTFGDQASSRSPDHPTLGALTKSPFPVSQTSPASSRGTDPSPDASDDPDADPPAPRVDMRVRTALPAFARPWTPVDPSADRRAREAAAAETRARAAEEEPTREPEAATGDGAEPDDLQSGP